MAGKGKKVSDIQQLPLHEILTIKVACQNIFEDLKNSELVPFDVSRALARNIKATKKIAEDFNADLKLLQDTHCVLNPDTGIPRKDKDGNLVLNKPAIYFEEAEKLRKEVKDVELRQISSTSIEDLDVSINPNYLEPLLDTVII